MTRARGWRKIATSVWGWPTDPQAAIVTNVGTFGISEGWAPLSPIYRVPMIVLVGEIEPRPWAVGDRVEVRPVLPLKATIDHRWVDGAWIAGVEESFKKYLANPLSQQD